MRLPDAEQHSEAQASRALSIREAGADYRRAVFIELFAENLHRTPPIYFLIFSKLSRIFT